MKEEQRKHQNEKTKLFGLKHEDEKRLHPHALKRFNDWKATIFNEVPQLEQLTIDEFNADINIYLNDGEKSRAVKLEDNISEWLRKCIDIGTGYSPYPYDSWIISSMFGLKSLITKAYRARAEKLEAERKEKEDSERWCAAYIAIKPPDGAAKKYLNDKEYEKFERATWKAVDVYTEKREEYLDDIGTFDYRRWLKEINYRKEKEQIRNDAQALAQAFRLRLDRGLKEIERKLSPRKKELLR